MEDVSFVSDIIVTHVSILLNLRNNLFFYSLSIIAKDIFRIEVSGTTGTLLTLGRLLTRLTRPKTYDFATIWLQYFFGNTIYRYIYILPMKDLLVIILSIWTNQVFYGIQKILCKKMCLNKSKRKTTKGSIVLDNCRNSRESLYMVTIYSTGDPRF